MLVEFGSLIVCFVLRFAFFELKSCIICFEYWFCCDLGSKISMLVWTGKHLLCMMYYHWFRCDILLCQCSVIDKYRNSLISLWWKKNKLTSIALDGILFCFMFFCLGNGMLVYWNCNLRATEYGNRNLFSMMVRSTVKHHSIWNRKVCSCYFNLWIVLFSLFFPFTVNFKIC